MVGHGSLALRRPCRDVATSMLSAPSRPVRALLGSHRGRLRAPPLGDRLDKTRRTPRRERRAGQHFANLTTARPLLVSRSEAFCRRPFRFHERPCLLPLGPAPKAFAVILGRAGPTRSHQRAVCWRECNEHIHAPFRPDVGHRNRPRISSVRRGESARAGSAGASPSLPLSSLAPLFALGPGFLFCGHVAAAAAPALRASIRFLRYGAFPRDENLPALLDRPSAALWWWWPQRPKMSSVPRP